MAPFALGLDLGDPELEAIIARRLTTVEEKLHLAVAQADVLADTASRHLVNAGGKRLRPMLCLLAAALGAGERPEVVDAAIVVELTHLATLYHDDVMDSAPLRRGAPAAHEVWGNSVAILTGDMLFARAAVIGAGLGPEAVRIQSRTFERLCLGQLHETVGPSQDQDPIEHYLQVLSDKTGSLVATSARFGAMFAGCVPGIVQALTRYGEKVGIAFQLADDVIDLASDGALTGKTPGTDLREKVPTMPVLRLREQVAAGSADEATRDLVRRLDGDLSSDEALASVVSDLRAHPVLVQVRDQALELAAEAVDELGPLPEGPVKRALGTFSERLVNRVA